MTTSKIVFDPFSQEFWNGAWDTYRRMQEEAPVYYNEQYDFYALTRHADVAAGLKDFETYSSAYGIDLSMVRSGQRPPQSIIFMDPPDHRHMRSLLNKVFTPRAIQSQREMVVEKIDKYLDAGRSRPIRCGAGLLRPVPRRGDHHDAGRAGRARAAECGTGSTCR